MIDLLAVFLLRTIQTLVLSMPTLLLGMIAAGVLVVVVGQDRVTRWLGQADWSSRVGAVVLAMLLPVCSIGVWPVLLVLRALGASLSSLVIVAMVAPLFTPWSLGYLLDRCGLNAGGLIVASNVLLGLVASMYVREPQTDLRGIPGGTGLLGVLQAAGRSFNVQVVCLLILACIGSGMVALFIPPNAIGNMLVERSGGNLVLIGMATMLSYVSPDVSAMRAGEVVNASTMPGLMVLIVALGGVMNVGTLLGAMLWRLPGVMLVSVLACAVALTVVLDRPFYDPTFMPEDTHAFEDVGRPFHLLDHPNGPIAGFVHRLNPSALTSAGVTAVVIFGLAFYGRAVHWTSAPPGSDAPGSTATCTVVAVLLWLLASAVALVYSYFPSPELLKQELRLHAAEVGSTLRTGPTPDSIRAARQIDRRLRQMRMILLLRGRSMSTQMNQFVAELTPFSPDGSANADRQKRLYELIKRIDESGNAG